MLEWEPVDQQAWMQVVHGVPRKKERKMGRYMFIWGATSLKLLSFEPFELFIFELKPSLDLILVFKLQALYVEFQALTRAFAE